MPGSYFVVNDGMGVPPVPADAASKANIVPSVGMLYNGSTVDLPRAVSGDAMAITGLLASMGLGFNGSTYDRPRFPNTWKIVAAVAITAATGSTIWNPASGKKFRLMGGCFSSSAAASLIFYEGLTTALTTALFRSPLLIATEQFCFNFGPTGILTSTVDMNLNLDVSTNSTVTGTVWGTEE